MVKAVGMPGDDVGTEKCNNQLASGCQARHSSPWSPTAMASKESVSHASYSRRTSGTRIFGGLGRSWTTQAAALGRGDEMTGLGSSNSGSLVFPLCSG